MSRRVDGEIQHDLTTDAVIRSMAIASALGATSSHTWLKVPVVEDMERVAEATTMPSCCSAVREVTDPTRCSTSWEKALRLPGRSRSRRRTQSALPSDDDVATAVKTAVSLL